MSSSSDQGRTTRSPSIQDGNDSHNPTTKKEDPIEESLSHEPSTGVQRKGPQERLEYDYMLEKQTQGVEKYSKLGWIQLVIVLIVEAIALGSLSIPSAFATLGMVAGTIICVGIGFVAIYTSYVVGQVKLKYPQVLHYSDVGTLLGGKRFGRFLREVLSVMFALQLILLVGSHALTGAIAFGTITGWPICSIIFAVVSAILLYLFAVPPSFSEMAILGYIDFVSIIAAILITLIGTGISAYKQPGGVNAVNWSAWPSSDTTFASAMVACTNIVFAYSFARIVEIIIYTCTGAIGYAFVGQDVESPALLSAGSVVSKVAFGIALPVIFISGSINTVTVCRFVMDRAFANSVIKYVNTVKGWTVWLIMIGIVTVLAWVIAEAIPFFSDLLGITSALFISGFSFYIPGIMWFALIKKGGCFSSTKNISLTLLNIGCIIIGLITLAGGFYGSVKDIIDQYNDNALRSSYSCSPIS